MKARIVIGANYGDEGKGTVVANYTKKAYNKNVLNVLTNGGAQRGHSILTKDGNITFQHFGSGTYHGADNYYSCFFILNPMQFIREYNDLIIKPKHIYRSRKCMWTTPYDSMANLIVEQLLKRKASCGMGIWNTIKRHNTTSALSFDAFMLLPLNAKISYLEHVKKYYEKSIVIPAPWYDTWNSDYLKQHFIDDCNFLFRHTIVVGKSPLTQYDEVIFENGQGLLLSDTGKDTFDTTPSDTGISYALQIAKEMGIDDITAHYVTRPYLTRHGDGMLEEETNRISISKTVQEDRTNHHNEFQGEFRYGLLNIDSLRNRIKDDAKNVPFELELTHCDEMDRLSEFNKVFDKVNVYDKPLV